MKSKKLLRVDSEGVPTLVQRIKLENELQMTVWYFDGYTDTIMYPPPIKTPYRKGWPGKKIERPDLHLLDCELKANDNWHGWEMEQKRLRRQQIEQLDAEIAEEVHKPKHDTIFYNPTLLQRFKKWIQLKTS